MHTKIIGTGSYLPKKVVTNDDLAQFLDTSDEWITTRTGIRQRHCADFIGDETCSAMGLQASLRAIEMANIKHSDIDLIITATITPDHRAPATACAIQELLGLEHVPAFDIAAACAGSIYGLSIANSFIRSGAYKNVLLVTPEVMTSLLNWQDRNTAILFGDGASAAILSPSDSSSGFIDFDLYADGRLKDTIYIPAGGSTKPLDEEGLKQKQDKIVMNGRETFKIAVRAMCDAVEKIAFDNNVVVADITFAVPHQANLRIIEAIAKRLNLPIERFLINLDRCANTSAASLLLAYDEANRCGKLKKDDLIVMLAIGAGFAWGAALYRV